MPVATYLDAISQELREEMRRDPNVFLMGEDIGFFGGAFKVTKRFIEEFGEERVIDTLDVPIPFSPPLEDAVLPSMGRIEAEARKLLEF